MKTQEKEKQKKHVLNIKKKWFKAIRDLLIIFMFVL